MSDRVDVMKVTEGEAVVAPPLAASVAVRDLVERLANDAKVGGRLVHAAHLPAIPARYGTLDPPLAPALAESLARRGVTRLWSHQAEGLAAIRRGEDLLITTPTASGKSLLFQVPPLEEAIAGGPGRALYLFPLKALGQDQRGKFVEWANDAGLDPADCDCEIYDGDTSAYRRAAIRAAPPRVLITNPDMLHAGILAHWTLWAPYLADLKWVVLDELHTYRGIFGSHFHHVLARLLRLCRSLGARPQIIASSATAEGADQFARALTGRDFCWISESGAPREGRHLLLFQPEVSPYSVALELLSTLLERGLKTIAFTKARRITELLYTWLKRRDPALAKRVANYRAGFLPEERRKIEAELFAGKLDGAISTSALEMGIDIGGLDACVLVGFPGSMMATWQRSGRVGRAGQESITALVALPDALDQYFLAHPEIFLARPCERLIVDPENPYVAKPHLLCAAAEMPLESVADADVLGRRREMVEELLDDGQLMEDERGDLHARRAVHRTVSLRGTGRTFAIQDVATGRTIGTVDGIRAFFEGHPGAVYLHAGRQYLVRELDIEGRRVRCEAAEVDWTTSALTSKETEILEVLETRTDGRLEASLARLRVTEKVIGFERRRIHGWERLGQEELDLPPNVFETVGLFYRAPRNLEKVFTDAGQHFMGSLHASEHAAISLLPSLAICDRGDLGGISMPFHPQVGCGAVFIYDGHPGGVGIAERGFRDLPELLGRVLDLLASCPCEDGCPACIQSPKCGNGNRPLDKAGAARLLRLLMGREDWPAEEEVGEASPPSPLQALPSSLPGEGRLPPAPLVGEEVSLSVVAPLLDPPASHQIGFAGGGRTSPELPTPREGGLLLPAESGRGRAAPKLPTPWEGGPPPPAERGGGSRWGAPPTTLSPRRTVLFDVETLRSAEDVGGWHNADRMGLAIGVVCFLEEGRLEAYGEARAWEMLEALKSADLVVGFNSRRFDYKVLAGYSGGRFGEGLPTLDLLDEIKDRLGYRVGLDHLAKETLGVSKSADGLVSLGWVAEGRLDLVEAYCRKDVEILRDLYLHGRDVGFVRVHDRRRDVRLKLRVQW